MTEIALRTEHLSVAFSGRPVVSDVSVSFLRGAPTLVVGRSGAGKSVLLKAAAGLLPRSSGRVFVYAPPVVFVHQDPALLDDRTVLENVLLPSSIRQREPRAHLLQRARGLLSRLQLQSVAYARPALLSPSQARRAALARALLLKPGVLIVDEPTTGLDPESAADVDTALLDIVDAERAVVVVTHHPRTLARLGALEGARVVVLHKGRLEQPVHDTPVLAKAPA
jgi:ABC-type multidrug transport system ATPase subunit